MKRLTISSAGVAFLAALAAACTGDVPSAAAPMDPALGKAPSGYTALDVGALLGNYSSEAHGVNDAGDVAGFYCCDPQTRPFALISGVPITLGEGPGAAWGMSNAFVVGAAGDSSRPARWSLANPAVVTLLTRTDDEVTAKSGGAAKGVNDAGDAVGYVARSAAMWLADGTRIPIATPAGYGGGEGRGINNAGLAVFQFFVPQGTETSVSRGYLRLASGTAIELPPSGSDVTSYANDISEVVNGSVYIAGSTRSSALVSRSVRWTVNATSGAILSTDVLSTTGSHGNGVSDAGGIAGFIDIGSFRSSAYLWRGSAILTLNPPTGTRDARVWALSRSGQYVAGQVAGGGRAVRWTITTP